MNEKQLTRGKRRRKSSGSSKKPQKKTKSTPASTTTTNMADSDDRLDRIIREQNDMASSMEEIISNISTLNSDSALLRDSVKQLDLIQLMASCIIRQQQQIDTLVSSVTDIKKRSMKNNILMHNIPEERNETPNQCVPKVDSALTKLKLKANGIVIERAHRLGNPRTDGKPRPIVARLLSQKSVSHILDSRPKEKTNGVWVSPQYPAEVLTERGRLQTMADEAKEKDEGVRISLGMDKLIINSQRVRPAVTTPTVTDVLSMDMEDRESYKLKYRFKKVGEKKLGDVTVAAFECIDKLKTVNCVREAYKAFLANLVNMKACHNPMAYKLSSGDCGYSDDKTFGMARTAYRVLQETKLKSDQCIFFSQQSVGNASSAKFDLIVQLTRQIIKTQVVR